MGRGKGYWAACGWSAEGTAVLAAMCGWLGIRARGILSRACEWGTVVSVSFYPWKCEPDASAYPAVAPVEQSRRVRETGRGATGLVAETVRSRVQGVGPFNASPLVWSEPGRMLCKLLLVVTPLNFFTLSSTALCRREGTYPGRHYLRYSRGQQGSGAATQATSNRETEDEVSIRRSRQRAGRDVERVTSGHH